MVILERYRKYTRISIQLWKTWHNLVFPFVTVIRLISETFLSNHTIGESLSHLFYCTQNISECSVLEDDSASILFSARGRRKNPVIIFIRDMKAIKLPFKMKYSFFVFFFSVLEHNLLFVALLYDRWDQGNFFCTEAIFIQIVINPFMCCRKLVLYRGHEVTTN